MPRIKNAIAGTKHIVYNTTNVSIKTVYKMEIKND